MRVNAHCRGHVGMRCGGRMVDIQCRCGFLNGLDYSAHVTHCSGERTAHASQPRKGLP